MSPGDKDKVFGAVMPSWLETVNAIGDIVAGDRPCSEPVPTSRGARDLSWQIDLDPETGAASVLLGPR